jgi:hypothetical protein
MFRGPGGKHGDMKRLVPIGYAALLPRAEHCANGSEPSTSAFSTGANSIYLMTLATWSRGYNLLAAAIARACRLTFVSAPRRT